MAPLAGLPKLSLPRLPFAPARTRLASAAEDDELALLRSRLIRAVSRVCPAWLASQRDDIVQTALVRITHILERSEGKPALNSSYLWKSAYTATVDEIRRRRSQREVGLDALGPRDVVSHGTADPQRVAAARELGRAIRGCLVRLVPSRRRAVTLHLQGHSVPEAARLLRSDLKAVENLVYRGLADLRACLSAQGIKP